MCGGSCGDEYKLESYSVNNGNVRRKCHMKKGKEERRRWKENSVLTNGDNNSEAGSETGASGGGGEEEGEPAEKGDRSHLVVWQVALPQSPNKMNPNMLF